MRKLWYAGAAVASGLVLFAASPARADVQPSTTQGGTQPSSPQLLPGNSVAPPFGDLLSGAGGYALDSVRGAGSAAMSGTGGALEGANDAAQQARNGLDRVRRPTNNLHVTVPLDGSRPLTRIRPGTNSPSLLPRSARNVPPASVIGPLEPQTSINDGTGLLGGIPLLNGLLPSGEPQWFGDSSFDPSLDRPSVGETESLPLLGGLLPRPGTSPAPSAPSVPDVPSLTGLPAGGMAVLAPAADQADPAPAETPSATPSSATPSSTAPADPRLHEEPVDPSERTFSPDGRPVAGIDQQFK